MDVDKATSQQSGVECTPVFNGSIYRVTPVGTESIVYPIDDSDGLGIATLNTTATTILQSVEYGVRLPDLINSYSEWFGVSDERARADVNSCLDDLESLGMVYRG